MLVDDLSSSFDQQQQQQHRHKYQSPRILAKPEQLQFDVLLSNDSGEYRCSVKQGTHVSYRTIQLEVYA